MATAAQELAVHEKKELVSKEEKTVPGRYYIPYTDIHETDEALTVVMEMPGVEKKDINVSLENDVLRVDGQIDFAKNTRVWSQSIPSTMWGPTRGPSRCPTGSIRRRSVRSSRTGCSH